MIADGDIRLASADDAASIALMSCDLIERDLAWNWTPARVLASLRDRATNVAVACDGRRLVGFGIMKYRDDEAHLHLLAVHPSRQRQGVGRALVCWLERCAVEAGIGVAYVEARAVNTAARAFYRALRYSEFARAQRYYQGTEDAVRLAKDLWNIDPH